MLCSHGNPQKWGLSLAPGCRDEFWKSLFFWKKMMARQGNNWRQISKKKKTKTKKQNKTVMIKGHVFES